MTIGTDYFKTSTIASDLYDIVAGDELGSGIGRTVHVFKPDPTLVIKFESAGRSFQNVKEWEVWEAIGNASPGRFLAPCVSIACAGSVLLQRRTYLAHPKTTVPLRLPAFLGDFKPGNFGVYEGRLVCHDYGFAMLGYNSYWKLRRLTTAERKKLVHP